MLGWSILAEDVVQGSQIEVHLPSVLGLERPHLQFNRHETAQPEVVEEEVQPVLLSADFQAVLAPNQGEADAKLKKEVSEVAQEGRFKIPFFDFGAQCEEIEMIGVLQEFRR